jgi:lysophospholipase L1-like esterase
MTPRILHWLAMSLLLSGLAGCATQDARPAVTSNTVTPAAAEPSPRFEAEIVAYEAADRARPPVPGGIVFVGSSSFRMWADLAGAFPGLRVVNRGFGGSTLPEVLHATPRIVLPQRPATVVLYAGDNDLNEGRTPAQVLADYREFAAMLRASLPDVRIVVVSIKPSAARWALVGAMREANRLLAAEIARDPHARFVDVFTPMLGADGLPRSEFYLEDRLHMTPAGYDVWREALAPVLAED